MSQRSQTVENYSSAVNSIALALGLLVGGIWTYSVFRVKLEGARAQLDYEKSSRELKGRPSLAFTLHEDQLSRMGPRRTIVVTLKIENKGTRDTSITFPDGGSVFISRIALPETPTKRFRDVQWSTEYCPSPPGSVFRVTGVTLRAGSTSELTAPFVVSQPGNYASGFQGMCRTDEMREVKNLFEPKDHALVAYSQIHYFVVK
jgi:hypothetical protein